MPRTLAPISTVDAPECQAMPSAVRVECPTCGKRFGGGSVVTGPVEHLDADDCDVRLRRFYCDHCDQVVAYREITSDAGVLSGQPLDQTPGIIRGRKAVESFLRRHPKCAGVVQR